VALDQLCGRDLRKLDGLSPENPNGEVDSAIANAVLLHPLMNALARGEDVIAPVSALAEAPRSGCRRDVRTSTYWAAEAGASALCSWFPLLHRAVTALDWPW
jgi:hypothetical protein